MRNVGLHLQMLQNDNNGYYPTCYKYVNGWSSSTPQPHDARVGYYHWTATSDPEDYLAAATTRS